jgi:hypothetical protein
MVSKYHVTRFVQDRLSEMEDAPSDLPRALSKMFDREVPECVLSALAAKFPSLWSACDALREARDQKTQRRAAAEQSRQAAVESWIARRDAGNLRAREQRAEEAKAQCAAAEAQRRQAHDSYCEQMQPTWDAKMREIELRRQLHEVDVLMQ